MTPILHDRRQKPRLATQQQPHPPWQSHALSGNSAERRTADQRPEALFVQQARQQSGRL